ncbi:hypothetical protein OAA83_03220 [Candidatus Marinimicrobia bacterium]|nr:hypothetical protein [Candidatus Neomarinimicrobiota bacterium]
MEFVIYLKIDNNDIYHKTMRPKDTLSYKFVLSDEIKDDRPKAFDQALIEKINKNEALKCYSMLMKLRLTMKDYDTPVAKLLRLKKYYENVLGSYLDFFEVKPFQLPQWRLDKKNNIPEFALNLVTGENIRLSPKQGKFAKLFYEHFVHSKKGSEWMWWGEAIELMKKTERINEDWKCMTDIFEKKEGREKLNKLFDSNPEGRVIYYRLKTED